MKSLYNNGQQQAVVIQTVQVIALTNDRITYGFPAAAVAAAIAESSLRLYFLFSPIGVEFVTRRQELDEKHRAAAIIKGIILLYCMFCSGRRFDSLRRSLSKFVLENAYLYCTGKHSFRTSYHMASPQESCVLAHA